MLKFFLNLQQIFLIFFVPSSKDLKKPIIVQPLLSSVQNLQYVMTFSFLIGNYGGLIDSLSLSMFTAFMRTFWMKTETLLSVEYHSLTSRLIIPKLTYSGYLKSPLSQNWIELLILSWLMLKYFLGTKNRDRISYSIKISLKVLFYPLMLSSVHTITTMIYA